MKPIHALRSVAAHTLLPTMWVCLAFTVPMGVARADVVTDWNEKASAVLEAEKVSLSYLAARTLSMVHAAMFDAVNAVEKRYAPFAPAALEATGASADAAAQAAARRVLVELYPRQKAMLDAAFASSVGNFADATKAAGVAVGEKCALAVLEMRKNDGATNSNTYRPSTAPGAYVTTAMPIMSHSASVKPFALRSVAQFRPGPPPALNSALWARDYNETMALGSTNSATRTAWQTETGRFWVISGVTAWNQAARGLVANKPLPLAESARLFAQLNLSVHDAFLAVYEAKFEYGFWRPVTAIRNGDRDGNDATERDAGWTPLIDTPLHPEYPCAHCVVDGAGGVVLKSVFGTGALPEFTLTYAAMPGVTRKYTSIQQLEDEVAMARIWGGVHFRNSNEVGNALGVKVGTHVLQNHMQARD
jgi:hypothetical protein